METWLEIVVRQIILYSLPVLISLTTITAIESRLTGKSPPHPFFSIGWSGTWLPWIASILFGRGMIIALPQPLGSGALPALYRAGGHLILCTVGFFLYSWSLGHPPATGLPPLHHWWAKVLMFYNLCMVCLNLLPLAGQWLGEIVIARLPAEISASISSPHGSAVIYAVLAATPLLDWTVGAIVVYPIYGQLAALAD